MKKTLSLLGFFVFLFSCSEKVEVTNFSFTPVIQTTSGTNINVRQPLSFSLKISDVDDATDGKLEVVYNVKNGTGNLIIAEQSLENGEKFTSNFLEEPVVKLKYLPINSGKHTVSLSVSNTKVNKTVSFDVDVNDMVINVVPANIPQIPMVEKRFSFDLMLLGENLAELGECTLKASVSKGSGEIYKEDILISEMGKTGVLKEGRNVITYYAKESGENILKFDIASQYGYTQEILVPIEIQKPEFTVLPSIHPDTLPVAPAAQDFSFKLNLNDDYQHGGITFKGQYRFITNSGSIKVNSKSVTAGADTEFKTGDNVIVFNGTTAGVVEMEFIITNQYGVQKIERVKFDVGGGSISLEARQIHTEVDLLDSTPIELTIVRPGYSGEFELQVTAIKGSGYILVDGNEYAVTNGWIRDLTNRETIQFKPDRVEDTELEVTVRDSKGETISNTVKLKYKVNNPPITLQIKGYNTEIMINNESSFSFTIMKKNYSGKFKFSVAQVPLCGKVYVEGKSTTNVLSLVTNPLNVPVQFTPTIYPPNGQVKLNFTFTDDYNTVQDTSIVFNVQTPPINVWFDADRKEYPIGESVSFVNRITQQGSENASFDISLKARNTPLVTWNGTRFNAGSTLKAVNGQQNEVKLQAVAKGENPITFVITDQYGKSVEKEVVVVGKGVNEVSFNAFTAPHLIPDPSKGGIHLKSNDPDNIFYCSYEIVSGTAWALIAGKEIAQGVQMEVHRGEGEVVIPVEIRPEAYDAPVTIRLTVKDTYGIEKGFEQQVALTNRITISSQAVFSRTNEQIVVTLKTDYPVKSDKTVIVETAQYQDRLGTVRKNVTVVIPKGSTENVTYHGKLITGVTNASARIMSIENPTEPDGTTYKF